MLFDVGNPGKTPKFYGAPLSDDAGFGDPLELSIAERVAPGAITIDQWMRSRSVNNLPWFIRPYNGTRFIFILSFQHVRSLVISHRDISSILR